MVRVSRWEDAEVEDVRPRLAEQEVGHAGLCVHGHSQVSGNIIMGVTFAQNSQISDLNFSACW